LLLVSLKPTLGIAFIAFFIAQSNWVKTTLWAIALIFISSSPVFFVSGFLETLVGFLKNSQHYSGFSVNFPHSLTGATSLIYKFFGVEFSSLYFVLITSFCVFIYSFFVHRAVYLVHIKRLEEKKILNFGVLLLMLIAFLPAHSYDWIMLSLLMLVWFCTVSFVKWLILGCWLINIFPNKIAIFLDYKHVESVYFPSSLVMSTSALIAILLYVCFRFWRLNQSSTKER
jgi:hypothetical protein